VTLAFMRRCGSRSRRFGGFDCRLFRGRRQRRRFDPRQLAFQPTLILRRGWTLAAHRIDFLALAHGFISQKPTFTDR
jgi:hypothetical protein